MASWWSGEAPQTQLSGYTPWLKSPSYDFSSALYSYMSQLIGQPMSRPPGGGGFRQMGAQSAGPALAPEMRNMMGLGQKWMNTGMPTVFGAGIGSLGRFMAPQFTNPYARMQMGAPNYFGNQMTPGLPGGYGGGQQPMGFQTGGGMQWPPQPQAAPPPTPYPMPQQGGGTNPMPWWRQQMMQDGGIGPVGGNYSQQY